MKACLLGFFQRLVVLHRTIAVVVAIGAQVLMMILAAFDIDLIGSIPNEGVVLAMVLSSFAAPFSSMRIDQLGQQGSVLLQNALARRLHTKSS